MVRGIQSYWKSPEQWSFMAFLGAGVLLLGHATVMGVQAFTNLIVPADVFAPVGHLLALVGLVGLYSVASDRTSTLAQVGAVVATVIAASWVVVTLSVLATTFGTLPPHVEMFLDVFSVLVLVSTVLPYTLFGVVTHRSEIIPRSVGLLLLAPAALIVALLADIAIFGASPLDGLVIGTGLALAMLAVGFTLRTKVTQDDRTSLDSGGIPG